MGIRSLTDFSHNLEHVRLPQEKPTNKKPKVPQPSPDNEIQDIEAWNHPRISTEQNITDAEQCAIRSKLYYENIVNKRELDKSKIETLRRQKTRFNLKK